MTVDNLDERLAAMKPAFQAAPVDSGYGGPMPPDGKYQAVVDGFDWFEAKTTSQLFLKTKLRIALDPEWNGTEIETVHNVEDPDRIQYVKKHLSALGLNVDELDFAHLIDALEPLLDVPVSVTVKRSDKKNEQGENYVNVYVNERLGNPMPKAESDVPAPELPDASDEQDDDGDIPF